MVRKNNTVSNRGDIRGCIGIVLFNPEFVNRRSVVRWENNGVAREGVLQVGDEKLLNFRDK